ncbi:MAG: NADH-quinone oxidoreductase subunit L [Chloroflexota bacterium]|nr:NADH-quinone oxidoreductase subunit L [Chloroflexota bacterium]
MVNLLWVAVAAPVVSCILLAMAGARLGARAVGVIACASVFISFTLILLAFGDLLGLAAADRVRVSGGWKWLELGDFTLRARLLLDPLSALLALIVTGVGGLIHVYAVGYMEGDPGYARFFAELNGFIAAMLLLTFADSVPLLAVGWIGVGIASALLIAFWYDRTGTVAAGRKAFLFNMVGDIGLIVAMAVFIHKLGTLDMATINANVANLPKSWAIVAVVGLLLAAGAKSAQLPLSGWLPDAMAGPTPVSALIHAATMVAAGIYLLIRLFPVIDRSNLNGLVAAIGALTALYGGLCALVQPNLKRVLAYSTVSQLGLMVFAIGMDATAVAAFHLATHAAFKAVLFLAAGSVIHALDGEELLDGMGGLARRLPQTTIAFAIAALALAGTPGLSGFFSKDAIVDVAREHGIVSYLAALAISALTAAYATRAFVRTFLGPPNPAHLHPPGPIMTVPQWILTVFAVVAGYLPVQRFLVPRLGGAVVNIKAQSAIISTLVALLAAAITWALVANPQRRRALLVGGAGVQRWLLGGMGLDAIVNAIVVRPIMTLADYAQGSPTPPSPLPTREGGERGGGAANIPFLAPLRHANLHRYVGGLATGAFILALYLLVRGA